MGLPQSLIDKLACPKCRGTLRLEQSKDRERLVCPACKLAYAITNDIPVLLIDEARTLK